MIRELAWAYWLNVELDLPDDLLTCPWISLFTSGLLMALCSSSPNGKISK